MSTTYTSSDNRSVDDVVRAFAALGERRIVSRSTAFRAGSLTAIAGDVTLDLLGARLAPEGAVVEAASVFGEIKILVPPGWRVAVEGTPVGGRIKNKGVRSAEAADGPELRVRATAVFGEVKVKRAS
jgi:predicted membrane protein